MKNSHRLLLLTGVVLPIMLACSGTPPPLDEVPRSSPSEVIDLGALVTEDLPERMWGKATLNQLGFTRLNSFEVISLELPTEGGEVLTGSNGYYTLFNHGGPHVDAPNHVGVGEGVDQYPIESFMGPLKVFDVSAYPSGRSISTDVFEGQVASGDVVLVLTDYVPPQSDDELAEVTTLTNEAAEFLARLPVTAFGTDSFSVESLADLSLPLIHHVFLSRGIPVYEQLLNVDRLLGKEDMFFVGVPLNIADGDGMMVRPVVLVY